MDTSLPELEASADLLEVAASADKREVMQQPTRLLDPWDSAASAFTHCLFLTSQIRCMK
jgi:hypothetical protein